MSNRTVMERIRNPPQPPMPILAVSKVGLCILPIAEIVIGALYLNDCPRQHYIPIYLVVVGVFSLLLSLLSCLPCARQQEDESQNLLSCCCTTWNSLTSLFIFCWFIAGNVWIYSIYEPNYDPTAVDYCNKTLYLFAFWSTTLVYILLGLSLLCGCCSLVCCFMCGRADPDDDV